MQELRKPLLPSPPHAFRRQSSIKRMVLAFQAANQAVLKGVDARRLSFDNLGARTPSRTLGTLRYGLGRWQTAMVVCSSLSGGGLGGASLALPYAVASVGWSGLLLIAAITLVTCWTGKLLVRSVNAVNARKRMIPQLYMGEGFVATYDQLAHEVLGSAGGMAMQVLTLFECYGCVVSLFVLQRTNWPAILGVDDYWGLVAVFITGLCSFFILFRDVQLFSLLTSSCIVLVATIVCFQSAMGNELAMPDGFLCPISSVKETPSAELLHHSVLEPDGFGKAIGLIIFCFAGHATFPTLRNQMAEDARVHFEQELDTGFGIAGGCYLFFGALGYALFGSCCADTVTLSLMQTSPVLGRIATVLVLISGFLSVPTWLRPVERIFLEWIGREARHVAESTDGQRLLAWVRAGLLCSGAIIAGRVSSFDAVISLMGAFSAALSSIILPVAFYLIVHRNILSFWQKALCAITIFAGVVCLVSGLSSLLGSTWMLMWLACFATFTGMVVTLQRWIATLHAAFQTEREEEAKSKMQEMPEELLRSSSRPHTASGSAGPSLYRPDSMDMGKREDDALQAAVERIQVKAKYSSGSW
ncbi:hypothetical protein AB1Y20_008447 [Prymnesium parvum]|uniref:Amino acid transporter transmembrane domain-containing protein n=1 Tax=Prymnesium parvum TaxID=97485 RepID=A0AB34IRH9_PRYPA